MITRFVSLAVDYCDPDDKERAGLLYRLRLYQARLMAPHIPRSGSDSSGQIRTNSRHHQTSLVLGGSYLDSWVADLLDRYRRLVARLDQARLLFIKHGVSGDPEPLRLVCGHLDWAQKEEVWVLASLCGRLQDWQVPRIEPVPPRAQ